MLWLDKPQATSVKFYQASLSRKRRVHGYLHIYTGLSIHTRQVTRPNQLTETVRFFM